MFTTGILKARINAPAELFSEINWRILKSAIGRCALCPVVSLTCCRGQPCMSHEWECDNQRPLEPLVNWGDHKTHKHIKYNIIQKHRITADHITLYIDTSKQHWWNALERFVNEVVLLLDETVHHAEPGTQASTECKPCFTAGFEEFLSCCAHISTASTVIGLHWSELKRLKGLLENTTFLHKSSKTQTGELDEYWSP